MAKMCSTASESKTKANSDAGSERRERGRQARTAHTDTQRERQDSSCSVARRSALVAVALLQNQNRRLPSVRSSDCGVDGDGRSSG